jgi:hypothetical protein
VTQLATDNFTRADANPISGPWTVASGSPRVQILSNVASAALTTPPEFAFNTSATWPADQYSEITAGTLTDTSWYIGPAVRLDATAQYGYVFLYSAGSHVAFLLKYLSSGQTTLASGTFTILSTDVVRLTVIGTFLLVTQNGSVILAAADADLATGSAGIGFYTTGPLTNTIGLWAAGSPDSVPIAVSDTFGRADQNPIAGNWTNVPAVANITGAVEIVSGKATETATTFFSMAFWNADIFPAYQYSEMSFSSFGAAGVDGPAVRITAAGNGYMGIYSASASTLYIDKIVAGNAAGLSSVGGITLSPSDVLRLEVIGTTLSLKVNGVTKVTATDSSFLFGSAGMFFYGTSGHASGTCGYWGGGDFVSGPPPPTPKSVFSVIT